MILVLISAGRAIFRNSLLNILTREVPGELMKSWNKVACSFIANLKSERWCKSKCEQTDLQ